LKATGIVRRIDDLGRLVIPKETRRVLRMDVGSAVEIFIENERVILQKYAPTKEFRALSEGLAEGLQKNTDARILICDEGEWFSGKEKGTNISGDVRSWVEGAKEREGDDFLYQDQTESYYFAPVTLDGKGMGGIIAYGKKRFSDGDKQAVRAMADFLSHYIEV
jgi:stage V sporulation protein T